ncbi:MAG: hypothetical protein CMJ78_08940 [Planctomycetaceae bacterium]|nr:hypothetical protein [Planctomycetaceae bacterium]
MRFACQKPRFFKKPGFFSRITEFEDDEHHARVRKRCRQANARGVVLPGPIKQARELQDKFLLEQLQPGPFKIADIGWGNGYHADLFSAVCELYHGFEISPQIAQTARELWMTNGIENAEIFDGDVAAVSLSRDFYDFVFCLYFTPGNLRDKSDDLAMYNDEYLDQNPQFIRILSQFYEAIKPGGSMYLTIYQDVPEAEAAQYDYYENTGQNVATPPGSRFVATKEGFWSVRFTKDSLLSNLSAFGIDSSAVIFNELNEISWLVEVKK